MEPFALFNLLKSLLLDGASAPSPSNNSAATPDNTDLIKENGDATDTSHKNDGAASVEATPQENNYCLDFIRRHEERAGRRK